jgi:glycosyltransferase involved in cell wall biosynthesis
MITAPPKELGSPPELPADQPVATLVRPLLTLVIPVRNAAGTLPDTLTAVSGWISELPMSVEVIVVDDASEDGSRATASAFGRRIEAFQVLRHIEPRGPFEAIRTGERVAAGTLIAFGREDEIACSLAACAELIGSIVEGADVAVLPRAPERPMTPIPSAGAKSFPESWRDWIRRAMHLERRDPAFLLCRAPALRRMVDNAEPADGAGHDWLALARRSHCALSVVRRGSASSPQRPRPAPTA